MKRMVGYSGWMSTIVSILLSIAFVTLLERKLLSLVQHRLGPNKVGLDGLIQPVLDGVKLLMKPMLQLEQQHHKLYSLVAYLSLSGTFMLFLTIPYVSHSNSEYQAMWLLTILGGMSHLILLGGWASNSKWGMLGSVRSLAQAISYEIVLTLMVLLPFLLNYTLNWHTSSFSVIILFLMWNVVLLIESHRAPFDLAESESELVSGFNTEFSSLLFVYFFLAEYGNILAMACLSSLMWYYMGLLTLMWIMSWLMLRTCFVRIRFDQLMSMTWVSLLPVMAWVWVLMINTTLL